MPQVLQKVFNNQKRSFCRIFFSLPLLPFRSNTHRRSCVPPSSYVWCTHPIVLSQTEDYQLSLNLYLSHSSVTVWIFAPYRLIPDVLSAAEEHICLHFSSPAHLTWHHPQPISWPLQLSHYHMLWYELCGEISVTMNKLCHGPVMLQTVLLCINHHAEVLVFYCQEWGLSFSEWRVQLRFLGSGTRRLRFGATHEFNQHFREPLNTEPVSWRGRSLPSCWVFIRLVCFPLACLSLWFALGCTGPA